MFIVSQFLLQKLNMCTYSSLPSYSIVVGLIIYASIYLYLLYYKQETIVIFNKFIIYIIGVDLLLSIFFYFKNCNTMLESNDDDHIVNQKLFNTIKHFKKQQDDTDCKTQEEGEESEDESESKDENEDESVDGSENQKNSEKTERNDEEEFEYIQNQNNLPIDTEDQLNIIENHFDNQSDKFISEHTVLDLNEIKKLLNNVNNNETIMDTETQEEIPVINELITDDAKINVQLKHDDEYIHDTESESQPRKRRGRPPKTEVASVSF